MIVNATNVESAVRESDINGWYAAIAWGYLGSSGFSNLEDMGVYLFD